MLSAASSLVANKTAATTTAGMRRRCLASGIDKVAENKIAEWLHQRGTKEEVASQKGKALSKERHKTIATALGVGDDYIHSKILADNNFKPLSVERRLELDKTWNRVALEIRDEFYSQQQQQQPLSKDEFCASPTVQAKFQAEFDKLNQMAKRVNDAIIEDSLRFNGRSPVPHARQFVVQERLREAILDGES